jgi:NAD(P)-dependent dehydrogenase (short-subunit alcohol dehydrogenase family)
MKYAPTILITGAASGLGRALAEQAAATGYRVAVADIHRTRGEETCRSLVQAGAETFFVECDVRREADLRRTVERVLRRWQKLDVMINNAGVASAGLFEAIPQEDWDWLFDINVMGTVRGCRAAVSAMKRQHQGHIVNIAGSGALAPQPAMSAWNAAQAAIVNVSESLRAELQPEGIQVTVACPDFFRTHLSESLRAPDPITGVRFERLLDNRDLNATRAAEAIMRSLARNQPRVTPGSEARRAVRQKRWLPGRFQRRMTELATRLRR